MSKQRLRKMIAGVLAAGLLHCAVARSQEAQPAKPAPPTHLLTGKQAVLPVTVTNQCPQQESFSVTTDGQLGKLLRTVQPISIDASSGGQSVLLVDTRSVAPGLYSGNIVVTCVSCGAECKQDRTLFPMQFQVDQDESAATPGGGQGTAKPEGDESKLVVDEPAPSGPGKGQPGTPPNGGAPQENPGTPGTKPGGGAPQEKPTTPGTQPGQTPTDGNPPGGPEKPPSGGNTPAPPGTGAGTGGSAPTPGGTTPGGATPGGPGGNGPTAPLAGGNAPPTPPAPGMGPDEGLPLPKIPPLGRTRRIAAAPCPCEKVCADAVAAEQKAEELLAEYMRDEAVVKSFQTLIDHLYAYISDVQANLQHYKGTGQPGLAAEEQTTLEGLQKDKENDYKELRAAQASAHAAGERYQDAAVRAANARLLCDACLEQHPECPQSIRAPGDTPENPPAANPPVINPPGTNPPGPTTTAGGGGTTPPPTQEKPKQPTSPGDNPNIPKPPDLHTPGGGNGYGHEEAAQCPQLHHGCIALVADLLKNDVTTQLGKQSRITLEADLKKYQDELDKAADGGPKWKKDHVAWLKEVLQNGLPVDLASKLKSAGCKVFTPNPELDLQAMTFNASETQAQRDKITAHDNEEMARLNKTIADFRAAVVANQPEVAITLVDAHGSPAVTKSYDGTDNDRCGDWGPGYYIGLKNDLFRAGFHDGNYQAANKNVCGWFNVDLSCYGGLTPKVTDELENYSASTCQKACEDCLRLARRMGRGRRLFQCDSGNIGQVRSCLQQCEPASPGDRRSPGRHAGGGRRTGGRRSCTGFSMAHRWAEED